MNPGIFSFQKLTASLALLVLVQASTSRAATNVGPSAIRGQSGAAASAKTGAKTPADASSEVWLAEIPKSEFVVPTAAREGRNPFSARVVRPRETPRPQPQPPSQTSAQKVGPVAETYIFVLNGLTSPPRATAMINGRTFEAGEEGEVRMANGRKVMIKCLEVRADAAVISVGGQRRELRLRAGL